MTAPIALRLSSVAQLYHTLDPTPFREGDLDAVAEAYILDWARELPRDAPLSLLVHLPAAELATPAATGVPDAIRHHFAARAAGETRALRDLFRTGRAALVVGLLILAACLSGAFLAAGLREEGPLARLLPESLVILGWVALWRPAEIFLYDWIPLVRQRRLYARLAAAPVELRAAG
jgi:hypothetical protein